MKYLLTGEETERLKFRLLEQKDFNTWIDLFKEESASRYLGMTDFGSPKEQCERWFELCENRYMNNLGGMNVLVDKITNQVVGQCGLLVQDVDGVEEMEIGYSILPQFWNKGYASEAAQKCRDYAFTNNYCDSLISIVHTENIKSQKVALKNGMALWKKTSFKDMTVNVYQISKEDWCRI